MAAAPQDSIDIRQKIQQAGVPQADVRLVAMLIADRLLTLDALPSLLERSNASGRGLVDTLRTQGLPEERLLAVQGRMYNMAPVILANEHVEEDIAQLITLEQARNWSVLPYSRNDMGEVLVATSKPGNVAAIEGLPKALEAKRVKDNIQWRLASQTEVDGFIDSIYRAASLRNQASAGTPAAASAATDITQGERMAVRSAAEGGTVKLVDDIIYSAVLDGASDIHILPRRVDAQVRFRVDGVMSEVMRIPKARCKEVVARIKAVAGMKVDEARDSQDGRVTYQTNSHEVDLRIVTIPVIMSGWDRPERVAMRVLDSTKAVLDLDQLGMRPGPKARYERAIKRSSGLALITGPTGSGKSTTLYASMNSRMSDEISLASIEDPVEYQLEGIEQTTVLGSTKMTFASALRSMMRADPDIIMVGEIRDRDTARTAVEASLTGHFIYSTLHTNDAIGSLTRLRELGVDPYLLSATLQVVVAQRLVRVLCPDCKQPHDVGLAELEEHRAPESVLAPLRKSGETLSIYQANPMGCTRCKRRGYRGRIGVHEVLTFTDEMRELILQPKMPLDRIEALARQEGAETLAEDAFSRVIDGVTSLDEYAIRTAG